MVTKTRERNTHFFYWTQIFAWTVFHWHFKCEFLTLKHYKTKQNLPFPSLQKNNVILNLLYKKKYGQRKNIKKKKKTLKNVWKLHNILGLKKNYWQHNCSIVSLFDFFSHIEIFSPRGMFQKTTTLNLWSWSYLAGTQPLTRGSIPQYVNGLLCAVLPVPPPLFF